MNFKSFYSVYRVLGWTSIVIASGLLILRFITPLMTPRVPQLSDWVAKELRYPTLIQEIKLNWDGLCPEVSLYNVQILTQNKKTTALHVQKIKLRLNVFQLLFKRLHVEELILDGVVGGVTYNHQDKNLAITNLNQLNFFLQNPQSDLFLLKRLLILNSTIKLDTDLGQNFALSGLNMLFESGSQIKVRAQAILDNEKKGHIELDVDYPYLSNKPKRFYCHWQNGDLNQLAKLIPNNVYAIKHQDADIKLWGDIVKKDITLHASLSLDNAQIKDTTKEPLFFNKLSGDLVAKLNASQWSLTSNDFKIVQDNQKENIQFSLKHSQQQSQPQWDVLFKDFDLAKWQQRLDDLNILPQGAFAHGKLQGIAEYGHVILKGSNNKLALVQGDLVLSQAGLSSKHYPSFSNAYGAITLNANEGKALLQSDALSLVANRLYEKPVLLDHLALVMNWQASDDALTFNVDSFHADVLNTPMQGEAKIVFQKNMALPDVDFLLEVGESSAMTALSLLPTKAMDTDLTSWLNAAIKKGEHLGTTCVLRGNLTDFPFDNGEGTFEIYSEFDKLHFEYNPQWPALFDLKANLHFRNRALFIGAEHGAIANGKLIDADAVIPDLFSKMPEVIVDTKIASTLTQGMKAIAQSPLPNDIVKSLTPLTLQGDMALSLGLEIPLSSSSSAPVKVRGLVEVKDASVAVEDNPHQITSLKGEVNFTQSSVKAHNLTGILLDNPTQFTIDSVSSPNRNEVLIGAKGNIKVEQIQSLFDLPEIKQVKGETEYTALLSISPQDVNHKLTLSSSLVGVAIDAPVPFAKEAQTINPIELVMYLEPNQLLRLSGKYGDTVSLAYSLKLQEKHWHGAGGHLHFGEKRVAKFREDQILLIDGDLPVVDFLEWKTFLTNSGLFSSDPQAKMPEPLVELDIGMFTLYGAQFEQENIQARWDSMLSQWSLLLDGVMLKGQITVPKENSKAIMVDFQKVALPKKLAQSNFTMSKVPSSQVIDIKIKELLWGNKSFSDLQARLEPNWKGYFIPNISTKLKDTQISMSGNWDYVDTNNQIFVQGKLSTKNISQTLTALGLKGTVQKARGIVDFSLTWNGSPFDIDFASLVGLADFSLKNGVIVGMNPGIGRVLSLLNLDNVKRRLNLDFSDVTKDGFAFTELDGKFQFGKGKVISNKVTLNGPSAKIEAFGQADLANQGLDGEMIVMPNVTGSLPVAAAIAAGNPAVGAAVWVVDKVFGNKIQQIHRMRYKVLGTWASPKVNEVPVVLKG